MFNPYGMPPNSRPQSTGYYSQVQPQQQQQMPQQLSSFNQSGQQNVGLGGFQQNLSSFQNQPQTMPQQSSGYNDVNMPSNQAIGQAKGNFYGEQNSVMLGNAGFESKPNSTNSQPPYSSSTNFQAGQMQPLQTQGTGFYNVPFQQPQIQLPQQTQQPGHYGQSSTQPQLQQQYQSTGMQPLPLNQQRTGLLSQPQALQQQATGPQVSSLQQQRTGPQTQFLQPQSTGYGQSQALLPQQTGFYMQSQQQTPMEPLRPNATGFINSFANNGINNDVKIPARRLSFITANDQAKFERLFRSRVAQGSNTISGNDCRAILMKSGLQPSQLARIWALCDTSKAGELLFPEFALAMHLVNDVLQGDSIPYELESKVKNEVSSFIDAINLSIASESQTDLSQPRTPFDQFLPSGANGLQQQSTGFIPQTSFGLPIPQQLTGSAALNPQNTGSGVMRPQITGSFPQTTFGMPGQSAGGMPLNQQMTGGALQPQNTGFMPQTSFNAPLQMQATGNGILQSQVTGGLAPGMMGQNYAPIAPQATGGFNNATASQGLVNNAGQQPSFTGGTFGTQQMNNAIPLQVTGGPISNLNSQSTGNIAMQQSSATGPITTLPQFGSGNASQAQSYGNLSSAMPSQSTGNIAALQSQQTGFLPPSGFNPTMPLTAQRTGFGNNEIYSQANFGSDFTAQNSDSITSEEKSLFYKIFETYDTNRRGLLDSSSAVEIFRKSGLNRNDLEHIWNLCDVNNSGQLNKQEFALGMHLVYRKLNGFQLPNRLPLSLIPSSTKIIDNVKNQLKNTRSDDGKQKLTKTDALSYKNNDDEALPSFRNRRKVFNNTAAPSSSPVKRDVEADTKREKILALRRAIKEKRAFLDSQRGQDVYISEQDELRRVETLKSELKNLPTFPNVTNDAVPSELKGRFDDIISKLPHIFSQIADVDYDISKAKIRLFKLKNPSSLSGSGVNGEITEEDRKKATSKALLKARMDALTGKQAGPTVSLEEEEKKYNEEINKIRDESSKNQHIIDDIRRSISEISASLQSTMNGGVIGGSPADFAKWEFGVGLQPEVRSFIESLNSAVPRNSASKSQYASTSSQPMSSHGSLNSQLKLSNSQGPQMVKQMPSVRPTGPSGSQKPSTNSSTSEDEEDEEERKLREELANLKLKKKAEKERRLADLRRQVEEARADSDDDESGTASVKNQLPASQAVYTSTPPVVQQAPVTPNVASAADSVPSGLSAGRNPFFKKSDSATSSFDSKAAETQRRLQRGLDDDDDDGWSDEETQSSTAVSSAPAQAQNQLASGQSTAAMDKATENRPVSTSSAAVVPLAPPLPHIENTTEGSRGVANGGSVPVPSTSPVPQVTANAPPVPIAPPLPQINSGSGFAMPPPPPPLPGQLAVQNPASVPDSNNDSDDVLSIPDSVASVDGSDFQPAGIPPPPPLP